MILPVRLYGDPVLRKKAVEITADYPNLKELIANMQETMYNASGVGLAAPQIGKAIRLFQVFLSMEQSYYRNYLKDEDTKFHGKSRHNNFFVSVHPATDTFAHPANHRLLRRKEFGTFFYPDDLCQAKSYSFVPVRMLQASCRQNGFNVETRGYTCYRL